MKNKNTIYIILLILITVAVFSNTFKNSFIWDDEDVIIKNAYIKSIKFIPFLFTTRYWKYYSPSAKGQYRPIRSATFALDYFLWGNNPFGYHITNLLLHILNVILIYFLVLKLTGPDNRRIAFLTAMFFATYPMHTESVTWIKNRSDVLALLFFILSLLFFIRYILQNKKKATIISYIISIFCFLISLISKEMAFSLPLILILYTLCFLKKEKYRSAIIKTLPFFICAALYFIFKIIVLKTLVLGKAIYDVNFYTTAICAIKIIGCYIMLLVFPFSFNAERIFSIPESLFEPAVISSMILLIFGLVIIIKLFRYSKFFAFAVCWIFLTLLPVSNITFLIGRQIAEQRLYIPSLGFCLLLGLTINRIKNLKVATTLSLLIAIPFSLATFKRNFDWKDSITFWEKTVEASPNSARAHYNLGEAYGRIKMHEQEIESYRKAIEVNPNHALSYHNLGIAHFRIGNTEEVIANLRKATKFNRPDVITDAYYNLGSIYSHLGKTKEAIDAFKKVIDIFPYYLEAYVDLAIIYANSGEKEKAVTVLKKAEGAIANLIKAPIINRLGAIPDAYYNLGRIYSHLGKTEEAISSFKKVIAIFPYHLEACIDLGIIYSKRGESKMAIALFKRAIQIAPDNALPYNNLGFEYSIKGLHYVAISEYKKAIRLDPGFAGAHNNLALAYYNVKQYDLAVKHCDKAIELGYKVDPQFLELLKPYRK